MLNWAGHQSNIDTTNNSWQSFLNKQAVEVKTIAEMAFLACIYRCFGLGRDETWNLSW